MPRGAGNSHRSSSRAKVRALVVVAVMLVVFLARWRTPRVDPLSLREGVACRVTRVVDGDTLIVAPPSKSGWPAWFAPRPADIRLRIIGADTPETVRPDHPVEPWGPEATEFTRDFVGDGEVVLEFDGPRVDKYKRALAHVYVGDRMLAEELIRAGLAKAKTHYPYSEAAKKRFREAEAEAKAAGRGIWSE